MKLMIVGDIHWSTYSSIVRSRGKNYSTRLEYLINSMNWVLNLSRERGCEEEIFLGDTFDRPDLNAEEISALKEIDWSQSKARERYFLVGNHESGIASLEYNSTQVLHKFGTVEDEVRFQILDSKTECLFLPYITEDNRKQLSEYTKSRDIDSKLIIFSHNDLKGFQMGKFVSKTGFEISDIEKNCDLYINGHLHNGGWVSPRKILNLGNLCGQNFSEDASRYEHHVAILDTDTLEIEFIENPYALNFYKLEMNEEVNLGQLEFLKGNAVVSIKCEASLKDKLNDILNNDIDLTSYKICYYSKEIEHDVNSITELQTVDHLEKFKDFVINSLGNNDIVLEELSEVCK